jgi:hypothetical protein
MNVEGRLGIRGTGRRKNKMKGSWKLILKTGLVWRTSAVVASKININLLIIKMKGFRGAGGRDPDRIFKKDLLPPGGGPCQQMTCRHNNQHLPISVGRRNLRQKDLFSLTFQNTWFIFRALTVSEYQVPFNSRLLRSMKRLDNADSLKNESVCYECVKERQLWLGLNVF